YDDNRSMEIADEVTYAKDIWASFMEMAHEDVPEKNFSAPADVIGVPIDPETGERATPYCPSSRVMYFEKGNEPQTHCTTHLPDGEDKDKKEEEGEGMMERLFELFRGWSGSDTRECGCCRSSSSAVSQLLTSIDQLIWFAEQPCIMCIQLRDSFD